jgi:hypothetical protein
MGKVFFIEFRDVIVIVGILSSQPNPTTNKA